VTVLPRRATVGQLIMITDAVRHALEREAQVLGLEEKG